MARGKQRHLKAVPAKETGARKKWVEVDASLIGLSVLAAFNNLEKGEDGEADVDLGGRTVRIRFDPLQKRILMFELQKPAKRSSRLYSPANKSTH